MWKLFLGNRSLISASGCFVKMIGKRYRVCSFLYIAWELICMEFDFLGVYRLLLVGV